MIQGRNFGHGVASAGVTQAFAGSIDGIDDGQRFSPKRIVAAAVIGGTSSSITGGKFSSGAVTGVFSRAFNDEAHAQAEARAHKKSLRTGRASFINLSVDFVQPGVKFKLFGLFGPVITIPETNYVLDIGYVKLDTNGDLSADQHSIVLTREKENLIGLDLGVGLEAGNGSAEHFFGDATRVNIGFIGNINVSNSAGAGFMAPLSSQTFSADTGLGGGVHIGDVNTREVFRF